MFSHSGKIGVAVRLGAQWRRFSEHGGALSTGVRTVKLIKKFAQKTVHIAKFFTP